VTQSQPLQAMGLGYPAIIVRDMEDSIRFYERLGLRPLYVEPNRDDPESITAMLYCGGNDTFLQLVGPMQPGSVNIAQASPGIGSMQYLSFVVTLDQMRQMWHQMSNAGVQGSEEITRGFERLVFLEDPNGVLITLTAWGVEPPAGMPRALVLQRAASLREEQGARYIEDAHIQQAISDIEHAVREG
jgi:catechol 2,3-dioxygenase-like lactoylglutathione lyase family enzyme